MADYRLRPVARRAGLLGSLLLLLVAPTIARADYVPDELLVQLKADKITNTPSLDGVPGAVVQRRYAHGLLRLKLPKDALLSKAMEKLRKDPSVAYVGPNHKLHICAAQVFPDDPMFFDGADVMGLGVFFTEPQWGLYNDGYNLGMIPSKLRADIHAPEAWTITTGSPSVRIAVLDTGLDYYQPDLSAKMWVNTAEIAGNGIDDDHNGYVDDIHGWNFVNNTNDPMDDQVSEGMEEHHGTFTSSVAGASTDNYYGIAGVAWGCPIVPLKVMDSTGYGLEADVATAVRYAADNGIKVINMSLAGTDDVPALRDAVEYAWQKGSICICSSGNEGTDALMYPASYPHALSVGATNELDARCTAADWSVGGSNYGDYLDVMAPGNNILGATNIFEPDGFYQMPGTSAAAPFVSGTAALIWSLHPTWTNQQVFYQILLTCDDIGTAGWDRETGWGRINAFRALTESTSTVTRISSAKTLTAGKATLIQGAVLSTASGEIPGRLYAQDADGSAGIGLYYSSGTVPSGLAAGDVVDILGQVGSVGGERVFLSPQVTKTGTTTAPKAVFLTNPAMAGGAYGAQGAVVDKRYPSPAQLSVGTNNIGRVVTIAGKVTAVSYDWFFIDDGTSLDDGSGNPGVYVYNGGLDRPALNAYAEVTGISSCDFIPGSTTLLRRVLRPRRQSDIRTVTP